MGGGVSFDIVAASEGGPAVSLRTRNGSRTLNFIPLTPQGFFGGVAIMSIAQVIIAIGTPRRDQADKLRSSIHWVPVIVICCAMVINTNCLRSLPRQNTVLPRQKQKS